MQNKEREAARRDEMEMGVGFDPGSFGCHEALHTTSLLIDLVDRELCEHEAIQRNAIWTAYAQKARDALQDLYDAIGREHIGKDAPMNAEQ
jgi:dihydroxyacetone kinase